jgi:hypothetical protein
MDALFKRYGHPFLFMDGMIRAGRFSYFVKSFWTEIHKEEDEKTLWEYYIHRVFEGSFNDFREEIENDKKNRSISDHDMEATIKHSMNILQNFSPEKGGES